MLAASSVGVLVIPMLYVVFQWLREKTGRKQAEREPAGEALAAPVAGVGEAVPAPVPGE